MIDIYIYENLINGKVYIGQTSNLKKRHNKHIRYDDKSMPIDHAIKKYGRDNFSLNIIVSVATDEQADYAEIDWIARARELLGKENVYNITDGGAGGRGMIPWNKGKVGVMPTPWNKGIPQSEETKKKLSESHKGQMAWNKGIPQSEEAKKKKSASSMGQIPWNKGIPQSEETKRKLSESHKGKVSPNKGKQSSEETKKKLSESHKGKPWSEKRRAAYKKKMTLT